jgi:hypothetical protein
MFHPPHSSLNGGSLIFPCIKILYSTKIDSLKDEVKID